MSGSFDQKPSPSKDIADVTAALDALLAARAVRVVDMPAVARIVAAEVEQARAASLPEFKFDSHAQMLEIAGR